jgi:hypothetical protein
MMEQCIYRGTTPSITLDITGADLSDASVWPTVIVTAKNGINACDVPRDKLTIAKTDTGCTVTFALTQEQTLLMRKLQKTLVQLRAKDADGHAIATETASVTVEEVVKDGEI